VPGDLHLTTPPAAGPEVHKLQEKLTALGYAPGPIDGVYGVATASALQAFQRAHALDADGIVGAATRKALKAVKAPAKPKALRRRASELGQEALAEAGKHIGTKESPTDSNKTQFGQWFGVNGQPWCNIFVSYCFVVGADYVICEGFRGAGVYAGKGCSYVPTTEAWLRATGMWKGRTTPLAGDIAIYNFDHGPIPDHIGIVEAYKGGDEFTAIEGNTGPESNSNGGEVMRQLRKMSDVDGFGRVAK